MLALRDGKSKSKNERERERVRESRRRGGVPPCTGRSAISTELYSCISLAWLQWKKAVIMGIRQGLLKLD